MWKYAIAGFMAVHSAQAQPRPLHNISPARPAHEISILRAEIQELRPADGGPSYFAATREPYRGKQEIVEVTLYGQEGIGVVRFELVDEAWRVVATVPAMRAGDGVDADGYILKVEVPATPFRLRIRGRDLRGRAFENTFRRLFVPMEGTPAAPIPRELEARFQPGDLRMVRAGISEATYEPLVSGNGNPIGLRVHFTVRFDGGGYYNLTPTVFPVYQAFRWRGEIGMRVLDAEGVRTQYQANTDYRLTFDFVPAYVNRRAGGSCIQAPPRIAVFEEIMASRQPVKYRVDISNLDFVSETAPLAAQRVWFEGFRREGVGDCEK